MRPRSLSIIVSSMAALLTGCQATTSSHQATRYSPEDIDWSDCVTTIPRDRENPRRTGLIAAGEQAPNFELESIDGDVVSLQDHRGQVVVLDFWASWCRPCANEMSIMNDFADQARENNLPVKVLSINYRNWMYPDQGIPRILHFLERHEIDLPVLYDDLEGSVKNAYGVTAIPTVIIIDPAGDVAATAVGAGSNYLQWLVDETTKAMEQ